MSTANPLFDTVSPTPVARGRASRSRAASGRAASKTGRKRGEGRIRRTKGGNTKKVFTFYLYDPRIRPKPKRVATVVATNYYKAAHKGASRGILPKVFVRKADSALVKVYGTERRALSTPRVVRRGNKTVTFRSAPKASLQGYFITPLRAKDKTSYGMDLNHAQAVDPTKPKRRPPPRRPRAAPPTRA